MSGIAREGGDGDGDGDGGGARPADDGGAMGSVGRRYRDWKGMFWSGDLESRGGGTYGWKRRAKKNHTKNFCFFSCRRLSTRLIMKNSL